MARKILGFFHVLVISSIFQVLLPQNSFVECHVPELKTCGFNAIYNFGSSLSDTGNQAIQIPQVWHKALPYGQSIGGATGRASDGHIMIDYIAKSAGLPLLNPYLNLRRPELLMNGVNFAVGGTTVLSPQSLAQKNITAEFDNSPLDIQLQWLDKYLKGYCLVAKDCQMKIASSLFTIIHAFNEYGIAFMENKTIEEVKNNGLVMDVVQGIKKAVKKFIQVGATRVLVTGMYPMGCAPKYLAPFSSHNSPTYDGFGCLKDYNDFAMYHNDQLKQGLEDLRKEFPEKHIVYGDMYSAVQWIFDNFHSLGFKSLTKACCGPRNEYNFVDDMSKHCGANGIPVCQKPEQFIFWDESHLTQNAYEHLTNWLIQDMFPKFQCNV